MKTPDTIVRAVLFYREQSNLQTTRFIWPFFVCEINSLWEGISVMVSVTENVLATLAISINLR